MVLRSCVNSEKSKRSWTMLILSLIHISATLNFLKDKGVLYALVVILLCVLFVALFKPLGYVICSAAVSFVIMVMIGKRNWVQMALVSVLVPLLMWFVFYKVLTVNIPMGPLKVLAELVDKI